jgi:hypothetical protein
MHDHRLPRHDRPPETWLPHPGTPDVVPPAPMLLGGGDSAAPQPAGPGWTGLPPGFKLPPDASPFARFVVGFLSGRKSIPLAIALAFIGPLGLFYISILHGVAALIVVSTVVRPIASVITAVVGGNADSLVTIAIVVCWCITVPWAILAARRRNARLDASTT